MMTFSNRTTLLLLVTVSLAAACSQPLGTIETESPPTSSVTSEVQKDSSDERSDVRNAVQFGTVELFDPLGDAIPGLGIDGPNVERDETLSLYQAYLRDLGIAQCMADVNFSYAVDPQYPREYAQAIGKTLPLVSTVERPDTDLSFDRDKPTVLIEGGVVEAVTVDWNDATNWNDMALATYIKEERGDAYMLALYGETLVDMERQGNPESDSDEFAQGGCFGKVWDQIPGVWVVRSEIRESQQSILTPLKEAAFTECLIPFDLPARIPADIEATLLDPDRELSDSRRVDLTAALDRCAKVWDDAGQLARQSKEFQSFVEQQAEGHELFVRQQLKLLDQVREDKAFAGFLLAAVESDGGVEFGEPPRDSLGPSEEAPLQVPLDAPDVDRAPDAAAPRTPPPEDFLATLPLVLNIEWGPGMPDTYANIEIKWDGESLFAEAAPAQTPMKASDAQVIFDCGDYTLRLTGPFVTGDPNPTQGPIPHALQSHLLESFGGECKVR